MRKKNEETGIEYVTNGIRQPNIRRKFMKISIGNKGNRTKRLTSFYIEQEYKIRYMKKLLLRSIKNINF